jgi:hypothetical protein
MNIYQSAILSGSLSGIVAILINIVIERFGGVIGGVFATIPSACVPATVGFYSQYLVKVKPADNYYDAADLKNLLTFQKSCMAMAIGMFMNAVFIYCWKLSPSFILKLCPNIDRKPYSYVLLITLSNLVVWLIGTMSFVLLIQFTTHNIQYYYDTTISPLTVIRNKNQASAFFTIIAAFVIHSILAFYTTWNLNHAPRARARSKPLHLFMRGFIVCVIVCTTSLAYS